MQNQHETLGEIIKNARIKADMTVETHRELAIVPDQIFFPEKQVEESEMESLVRMLYSCDERSIQIIKATIKAALESQSKE